MRTPSGRSIYEDDVSLFATDEQRDYYRDESTWTAARDKCAWVRHGARAGSALLDVGANFGYFVKEASQWFDARGLEPSPPAVAWARDHLQAPVELGSIDEERPDFAGRFETITMFDVIEHLPDPRAALVRCHGYLAPRGRLFITTPDIGSLMARLLGRQWYYIDFVEHVSLFSKATLTRLLADTGFAVVATRTIGRRYRLSYIERRLRQLAASNRALTLAHAASLPLTLWPNTRIPVRLGDVLGVEAAKASRAPAGQ
jgi:SAM-dependent methyltransferase